jgi:hypothetical protein
VERLANMRVFLTPSTWVRSSRFWSAGLHLLYCALILAFHRSADLPLQLGLLAGAGFLVLSWALAWVRTHANERVRQVLVGILAPLACLCWGAALSPLFLFMLLKSPEVSGRFIALGLGPWAVAWAIGGAEFRDWLGEIPARLLTCAGMTWVLFLVPHVFIIGMMVAIGIGLSSGWATYLAILTGVLLAVFSARVFALLDDAAGSGGLNRARVLVLKGATLVLLLLLVFPPWRVEDQVWGIEEPDVQLLSVDRNARGVVYAENYGIPRPRYGPPHTRYEPWYMCFYRQPVDWVGPDISGPDRLQRIPRNDAERIHVRYVQPNRRLSLEGRRWLVAPGVTAFLTAGLFAVLRGQKITAQ